MKKTLFFISMVVLFASCKKEDPAPIATSIELIAGNGQSGLAGQVLDVPIEVIVKDEAGNPFFSAGVYFSVTEGGVTSELITTGKEGKATNIWTLGNSKGVQSLTIRAFGADGVTELAGSPVIITATSEVIPQSIELVSGSGQSAEVGNTLEQVIEVLVKDHVGNPYEEATVNYSIAEGSVSVESSTTNSAGKTDVSWTLGSTLGNQTISITAFGEDGSTPLTGSPLNVTAEALFPTAVDYDGNTYGVVHIGNQFWMAENLKTTHSANGASVSNLIYNNDVNNLDVYGRLYTWSNAMSGSNGNQGICPNGWHIPTDAEFQELIDYLGGDAVAGGKLKEAGINHWITPNTGATNSSGFDGLPAGFYDPYTNLGIATYFWSSTEIDGTRAWTRNLYYDREEVVKGASYKGDAVSVRCIKN